MLGVSLSLNFCYYHPIFDVGYDIAGAFAVVNADGLMTIQCMRDSHQCLAKMPKLDQSIDISINHPWIFSKLTSSNW